MEEKELKRGIHDAPPNSKVNTLRGFLVPGNGGNPFSAPPATTHPKKPDRVVNTSNSAGENSTPVHSQTSSISDDGLVIPATAEERIPENSQLSSDSLTISPASSVANRDSPNSAHSANGESQLLVPASLPSMPIGLESQDDPSHRPSSTHTKGVTLSSQPTTTNGSTLQMPSEIVGARVIMEQRTSPYFGDGDGPHETSKLPNLQLSTRELPKSPPSTIEANPATRNLSRDDPGPAPSQNDRDRTPVIPETKFSANWIVTNTGPFSSGIVSLDRGSSTLSIGTTTLSPSLLEATRTGSVSSDKNHGIKTSGEPQNSTPVASIMSDTAIQAATNTGVTGTQGAQHPDRDRRPLSALISLHHSSASDNREYVQSHTHDNQQRQLSGSSSDRLGDSPRTSARGHSLPDQRSPLPGNHTRSDSTSSSSLANSTGSVPDSASTRVYSYSMRDRGIPASTSTTTRAEVAKGGTVPNGDQHVLPSISQASNHTGWQWMAHSPPTPPLTYAGALNRVTHQLSSSQPIPTKLRSSFNAALRSLDTGAAAVTQVVTQQSVLSPAQHHSFATSSDVAHDAKLMEVTDNSVNDRTNAVKTRHDDTAFMHEEFPDNSFDFSIDAVVSPTSVPRSHKPQSVVTPPLSPTSNTTIHNSSASAFVFATTVDNAVRTSSNGRGCQGTIGAYGQQQPASG